MRRPDARLIILAVNNKRAYFWGKTVETSYEIRDFRFTALKFIRPRRAVARSPGHESRHAASLGDGTLATQMDQRTEIPIEQHHPMTCWDFRATAASM